MSRTAIENNLRRVRDTLAETCLRAGRDPRQVTLVAVTKSAGMDAVRALVELGVTELAESRAQHLAQRAAELGEWLSRRGGPAVRWHMVGHLQRNKVKDVLEAASVIHSVDSLRLAEDLNARAEKTGQVVDILLQVNCSLEPQKFGCAVGAAGYLGELVGTLPHVRLVGLMTMAAADNLDAARAAFRRLREIYEEMRHERPVGAHFRHLSMGMSQDYVPAVEEGATMVRIGSALFEE